MGGACDRTAYNVMLGRPEAKKNGLDDLGIHDMIILEWITKRQWDRVDWINLAQDRDRWRVLVDTH
jgi:hypothetical protein